MNYQKIVQDVIDEHEGWPDNIFGIGDSADAVDDDPGREVAAEDGNASTSRLRESPYLNHHKEEYIRTVGDIDKLFKNDRGSRRILEIGPFLGTVSISLKRLGYRVSALDIPEFQKLGALYEKNGIDYIGLNLRHYKLPYESDSFDAVIICEVIEHLNFNPLPVLMEINRVLKNGGYIYIGMPNQASYGNRKKLLLGKSIHNSIDDFFSQLDRKDNMIVGLHWREYTMSETTSMIEKIGFQTFRKYYFGKKIRRNFIVVALKQLLRSCFPFLLPSQVVIGRKVSVPNYNFWLTEANS